MPTTNKELRTHTHASNRSKPNNFGRKVVFKSALSNPFRIQWPSVPINVQNSLLATVLTILDDVSKRSGSRVRENRKRKRARKSDSQGAQTRRKQRKVDTETGSAEVRENADLEESAAATLPSTNPPEVNMPVEPEEIQHEDHPILRHLTIGINEVTKRLENQIRHFRRILTPSESVTTPSNDPPPDIKLIFVCRADIDTPLLIAHLPYLVAAYNSSLLSRNLSQKPDLIKLLPLPKSSEWTLADVLGLRRVAVMAIDCTLDLSAFAPFLDSVPTLSAMWLAPQAMSDQPQSRLIPAHIKQIRTSAPKDLKAVKAIRAEEKLAAKRKKMLTNSKKRHDTDIK